MFDSGNQVKDSLYILYNIRPQPTSVHSKLFVETSKYTNRNK